MDTALHCNVCYNTLNEGQNQAEGVQVEQVDTDDLKLICQECKVKAEERLDEDKASAGLTIIRSSKTSKSQTNAAGGSKNVRNV